MPTIHPDNRRHEAPGNPELHMTRSEDQAAYAVNPEHAHPGTIVAAAIHIIMDSMKKPGALITSPDLARQYFYLELAKEPAEVFCCLFLDNRHQAITMDRMFNGTIDGASVHPREVVRACIQHNAAAVMLCHNHPSGVAEPSQADIQLTKRLVDTLALIDVKVLDHLVIGTTPAESVSFAERGLI